jgi:two-component system cell cycle response regulator
MVHPLHRQLLSNMIPFSRKLAAETRRDVSILIVDDDELLLKTITRILVLSDETYFIETATNVESMLELVGKTYWDTILLDLSLPQHAGDMPNPQNGLNALEILKKRFMITTPIIAITGYHEEELSDSVLDKGAYYFLNKPVRAKYLSAIVKNATRFQMSGFDGLTGLLNRMTFEERLKSEFERAVRKHESSRSNSGQPDSRNDAYLSLIYIDGDNFKLINDSYSHLVGDMVLKKISGLFFDENIYRPVRRDDDTCRYIIRPYDMAARFGGDEFCIFMPETDHARALTVATRIRDRLQSITMTDIIGAENVIDGVRQIAVSIGIATYPYPNNVTNYEQLISCADYAMYGSKSEKQGHIFGYNADGALINFNTGS